MENTIIFPTKTLKALGKHLVIFEALRDISSKLELSNQTLHLNLSVIIYIWLNFRFILIPTIFFILFLIIIIYGNTTYG